jgi:hypothetical protein
MMSADTAELVLGVASFSVGAIIFLVRSVKWFLISHHLASLKEFGNRGPRVGLFISAIMAAMISAALVAVLLIPLQLELWLSIAIPVLVIAEAWNTKYWGGKIS